MKNRVKNLKKYKTRINGISVEFQNVPYEDSWGSQVIKINFHSKELENQICLNLLKQRPVLTGGVLKYIRHYLDYSLQKMNDEFFGKTKATLSDWESNLDKTINTDFVTLEKIYKKLLAVYQGKILENLLSPMEKNSAPYTDANPLVLAITPQEPFDTH